MDKFLKKNLSLISFVFIPIIFLWHPNWLGILGIQPYWPLFWLLPWSMIYGSINGLIVGLFLGLILDSIASGSTFTQIPGLIVCGFWFGRIGKCSNSFVSHFRHGLICAFASLLCSTINFLQILIINFPENSYLFLYPSIKNILAQAFLTALFAPLICSQFLKFFNISKENVLIKLTKN